MVAVLLLLLLVVAVVAVMAMLVIIVLIPRGQRSTAARTGRSPGGRLRGRSGRPDSISCKFHTMLYFDIRHLNV